MPENHQKALHSASQMSISSFRKIILNLTPHSPAQPPHNLPPHINPPLPPSQPLPRPFPAPYPIHEPQSPQRSNLTHHIRSTSSQPPFSTSIRHNGMEYRQPPFQHKCLRSKQSAIDLAVFDSAVVRRGIGSASSTAVRKGPGEEGAVQPGRVVGGEVGG